MARPGISDKAGIYQLHCVGERERGHSQTQAGHRLIMDVIIWSNPLGLATQRPLTTFGEQKCCHGLIV